MWSGTASLGGEGGGLVEAEGVPVEVSGLVGVTGGGDLPGSACEFAGDSGGGRDVVVATFAHEAPVVLGELGVPASGDVGGLVEGEAQLGGALFGDLA